MSDQSPALSDTAAQAAPPAADYQPLDPRVVTLWRIADGIFLGIMIPALLAGALFLGFVAVGHPALWLTGWGGVTAAALVWLWWYPAAAYRAWGYRLTDRVLETRSGIWFRVVCLLPLPRLQHVDLRRGPLERSQGLASLVLHTAGTHEASLVLPGLDAAVAEQLRDRLVVAGGDDGV